MEASQSLEQQKARLRNQLRERLSRLKPEEKLKRSEEILERLYRHPSFLKARTLLIYLALPAEVQTRALVDEARKKEKKVYVPRVDPEKKRIWMIEVTDPEKLGPGFRGILEPPFDQTRIGDPKDLDLAIIPGLGFDRDGGRLGRGEGYFDRFLQEAQRAYKIGLAFECQIIEKIPRTSHDVVMDEVLMG